MEEEEMNIKNIIEPYEKRIKELEETIRKKDFEIAVLKQKIFNINKSQKNKTENINNNYNSEKINVIFINHENQQKTISCSQYEKTKKLFERYLNDSLYEIRELIFSCDNNIMRPFKILKENGIYNNSIIQVQPKKLMSLVFERNGDILGLNFDENISVGMAFIYYLIETEDEKSLIELINNENSISFIHNNNKYSIRDKSCIKNIFPHLTKILVIEHGNIIGGNEVHE